MKVRKLGVHNLSIDKVAYSSDGKEVVSSGRFHDISFWDVTRSESDPLRTFSIEAGRCHSVCYSPDGKMLASCHNEDHSVRLWEVKSGKLLSTLSGHTAGLSEVTFSPDGELLLSVGGSGTFDDEEIGEAFLWDIRQQKLKLRLPKQKKRVSGGAFSPSGKLFATCGWEKAVTLWDRESGKKLGQSSPTEYGGNFVVFLSEKVLISVTSYEYILFWDLPFSGDPVTVTLPRTHSLGDGALEISLSRSKDWFVSAGLYGIARLWNTNKRTLVAELTCDDKVSSVSFSPDECQVALAVDDEVLLWDVSEWTRK